MESAKLDELNKTQKQRFYNFAHLKIPNNLQNAFVTGSRVIHRPDLMSEPGHYRELKYYLFEDRLYTDIVIHIQQHKQQFKS